MFRFSTRRTLLIICALAGFSYGFGRWAQSGLTPPPRPDRTEQVEGAGGAPFAVGESLTYNVSWTTYPTAARLEIEVAGRGAFFGVEGFELRTRVETSSAIRSLFLDLDSQYTSYVDAQKLLPHRLENSIRQGERRSDETVLLDQAGRKARFGDEEIDLPGEIHDLTSLLYALRLEPLGPENRRKFSLLYGRQVIEIEAEGKETARIATAAGTYEATCINLTAKAKKANLSRYRVKVWLSNDARRLPVLLTARLPLGEVRAEIVNVVRKQLPEQTLVREKIGEGPKKASELYAEVERSRPFSVGERLNYDVSWSNFASLGKASFAVRQRGRIGDLRVIELVGEVTTIGAARSLIDVNDQMISFVEVNTLAPVRSEIRLKEGSRSKQTVAEYNWSDNTVRLTNGTHFKVEPRTLDLVSLFYQVRAANLEIGQVYNYTLLDANHRPAKLVFKVIKQEMIGSPLGAQNAFQLDVYSHEQSRNIAQVWISADSRRLPLYLAVRTPFGEIRFQLQSAAGTR